MEKEKKLKEIEKTFLAAQSQINCPDNENSKEILNLIIELLCSKSNIFVKEFSQQP